MKIKLKIFPMEGPFLPQHGDRIIIWVPGWCWATEFDLRKYRIPKSGFYHWSRFPEEETGVWLKSVLDRLDPSSIEQDKWGDAELMQTVKTVEYDD